LVSSTPALEQLSAAGIAHATHPYVLEEALVGSYGEAVARILGVSPDRVFKTLVAMAGGKPVIAIVPVAEQLRLKALAAARGVKHAEMATPQQAERLTGYVVGGISPFGRRRELPVLIDSSAAGFPTVFVSAGRRGLQVEVAPEDLIDLLGAQVADLV
jgi:Cys-tRNA(Pro)/Cys-tRNA(Cys) deacylase